MNLQNDKLISISTGDSRRARIWFNKPMLWSALVERCSTPIRTPETVAEYFAMSRDQQSDIKDVGGFVGGTLRNGTRKKGSVQQRSVLTLDIDFGTSDTWDEFVMGIPYAAMMYSTHKHTPEAPRLRLVMPTDRPMEPHEYEPVARRWAQRLGIEKFDHTTFQPERLMYWPSTSKDGEYFFQYQDGPFVPVDKTLATYNNPNDPAEWPRCPQEEDKPMNQRAQRAVGESTGTMEDPRTKAGLIGAFCRCYDIETAMEVFLPDIYEPSAIRGRYTYKNGSSSGGVVVYNGLHVYSHHESDPAGGQTLNAFDLVRIHKFGIEDAGTAYEDITKAPSYIKMLDFVSEDPGVKTLLTEERAEDYADIVGADEPTERVMTLDIKLDKKPKDKNPKKEPKRVRTFADGDWRNELDYDRKGNVVNDAKNIIRIIENDEGLKGKLFHDLFSGHDMVCGGLPWDETAAQWSNRDDANLRTYLELNYGVTGKDRIRDAFETVLTRHSFHPIRDYLNSLKWDGVPRLDRLVIDYLGAVDDELTRAMTRKHFTAAVARVMRPGCKYDYCLLLTGPEGAGKSTMFRIMGGAWFTDSVATMEGKQGMEQVRGSWIIELSELSSIKKSEVEQVKSFLSKVDDKYRPAYGRVVEYVPRQCVFCGTTNEVYFLKGDTGNRRFWVVKIFPELRKVRNFNEALKKDRDQLWAEAVHYYNLGENLYLCPELEAQARQRQQEFNDNADDPIKEMLLTFLDTELPASWRSMSTQQRRDWLRNPNAIDVGYYKRDRVCIAEFICEQMGRERGDKEYKYLARKVASYLEEFGWVLSGVSRHAQKLYGVQKYYVRPKNGEENDDDLL